MWNRDILRGVQGTGLVGLWGRPSLNLERFVDLCALDALHDEVCLGLAQMPVDYTGGSHRAMGIMPRGREREGLVDYLEVIRGLDDAGFETFRALGDEAGEGDPEDREAYGEERSIPLSRKQMLWLKFRHGVYFPWKVYVEMIPNRWWSSKSDPSGKRFTRHAEALLPRTVAYVRALPFKHVGRCNIMGLEANDHGTLHRDGDPVSQGAPDEFISLSPAAGKRLFLWDPERATETAVEGRAYWFNDHDHHGVHADPFFRYSIRVDGEFTDEFRDALSRSYGVGA